MRWGSRCEFPTAVGSLLTKRQRVSKKAEYHVWKCCTYPLRNSSNATSAVHSLARLVDQFIELGVHAVERSAQRERQHSVLAVNMARAGRSTRASRSNQP